MRYNTINFHDPRPQTEIIKPPVTELTAENTDQVVVKVRNGTLVVFPSWLVHSVDANRSDETRLSISFNVMFSAYAEKYEQATLVVDSPNVAHQSPRYVGILGPAAGGRGRRRMREILNEISLGRGIRSPTVTTSTATSSATPKGTSASTPLSLAREGLDEIARLGATRILLTNRNHSRASNKVRERTGARASIHPDEAAHARDQGTALDDALTVAQTIGPLLVVGAPGKSSGEVALHWPARHLLIVGDVVIGSRQGSAGFCPNG